MHLQRLRSIRPAMRAARCSAAFSTALNAPPTAAAAAVNATSTVGAHGRQPLRTETGATPSPFQQPSAAAAASSFAVPPPAGPSRTHGRMHPGSAATPASPSPPGFATRVRHNAYDVTIVGGGMVGSALALALATSPITRHLRVCLIESVAPSGLGTPLSPAPSLRVSAVTPASASFFERLGAWSLMGSARVSRFTRMRVWHTMEHGEVEWNLREMQGESADQPGQVSPEGDVAPPRPSWDDLSHASDAPDPTSALGFIVENDVIQHSLWARMQELVSDAAAHPNDASKQCNLELVAPVRIEQILPGLSTGLSEAEAAASGSTDWPHVLLSNEQSFSTRLLIGADGPGSLVKQYAGSSIQSYGWDYNARAVVATLKIEGQHSTAFQRFLPTGPIAFLPCHEGYANLVWSTTPSHAKQLCGEMNPEQFTEAVNKAFSAPASDFQPGGRAASFESLLPAPLRQVADVLFPPPPPSRALPPKVEGVEGPRLFFPLRFIHATRYVSPRVVLLGDAAHVVHPLAGQGVNLGFGDAEELARVLAEAVQSGADLGDVDFSLRAYEERRMPANAQLMGAVDALQRTFAPQDGPLAAVRAAGLTLFNAVPAIKNRAAEFAMGLKLKK